MTTVTDRLVFVLELSDHADVGLDELGITVLIHDQADVEALHTSESDE